VALVPTHATSLAAFLVALGGFLLITFHKGIPKAYGYGVLCLFVFGMQTVEQWFVNTDWITQELGFRSDTFLAGLSWWTPITYMFIHASFLHIFGNLFVLVSVGPIVEDRLGGRAFAAIFTAAGLGAVGAHLLMVNALHLLAPDVLAVGASGAIFGVLTIMAWFWPMEEVPFPIFLVIWLPAFVVLLLDLALNIGYMFSSGSGIAWYGHFGGFLVGLAMAPILRPKVKAAKMERLPDPDLLLPLATTPQLANVLGQLRSTATPGTDPALAEAWLDQFFAKARCPSGHAFERTGMTATCKGREFTVSFAKA
jgi:membrane associated rhomboid family serine protease